MVDIMSTRKITIKKIPNSKFHEKFLGLKKDQELKGCLVHKLITGLSIKITIELGLNFNRFYKLLCTDRL